MKKKNILVGALAAAMLVMAPSVTANAADAKYELWDEINGKYVEGTFKDGGFQKADGSWATDGIFEIAVDNDADGFSDTWSYYAFDASGWMLKGWQEINGAWYYFDAETGEGAKGKKTVDGVEYYFYGDGQMAIGPTSVYEEDLKKTVIYLYDQNGAKATGWQFIDYDTSDQYPGSWYVAGDDSIVETGWYKSGDDWYFLNESGAMVTGRDTIYTKPDGTATTDNAGWFGEGEDKKYVRFEEDGDYYFTPEGKMITGWYSPSSDSTGYPTWYYAEADGKLFHGWLGYNGAWYIIEYGKMIQDTTRTIYKTPAGESVDSVDVYSSWDSEKDEYVYYIYDENDEKVFVTKDATYRFAPDGKMITGWFHDTWTNSDGSTGDVWYWSNDDGSIPEDGAWVKSGNNWYYVIDGVMQRCGTCVVGEWPDEDDYPSWEAYYAAQTKYELENTYVFGADGAMVTGWYGRTSTNNGVKSTTWFYADANGVAHNGWLQDGGNWYYFINGVMQTNRWVDGGYFVAANGVWYK